MTESTVESTASKGRRAPKGKPTPKAKDREAAAYAAYRKAKMQWYALAALFTAAVIVAIVLLSLYTEGSTGGGHT